MHYGEITVSLDALRRNAAALRDLVDPSRAAFVVKSNAYGHGLIETALAVEPFASRICVYDINEVIALRDGGVTAPIIALGPVPQMALPYAAQAHCAIALWDVGSYEREVIMAARSTNTRIPVHVKVNTGVNRYGLSPDDVVDAVEEYLHHPEIQIDGIFSHLAAAEELDSPFTMLQLERFTHALERVYPLFENNDERPIAHIAASAAAMLWPQTRLDMARFGIALYGLWPSPQTREAMAETGLILEPALWYRASITAIQEVPAGEPIGYGCTYHAPHTMRIGVVPLGYADGIPRALSNTGAFLVEGVHCAIVGRIGMNATMIDLSAAPSATVGSPVMLIGRQHGETVTADDWAAWSGTINYEIVTRLPGHIRRTYVDA